MRDILKIIHTIVLFMWPMAALAAGESLGSALTTHSLSDWVAVLLVSTVSGLVALLHRIRKNMEAEILEANGEPFDRADRLLISWKMFASFHMSGSYGAGFFAFLLGEHLQLDNYLHALGIALFAWVGAQLLDKLAGDGTRMVSRIFNAIGSRE